MNQRNFKPIAQNRNANFHYFIEDTIEAGIMLSGCEVKSIRQGKVNLSEAYAKFKNNELWLLNCHISPYTFGNRENPEPTRDRKLLIHRYETKKLIGKLEAKGYTLVPVGMFFSGPYVKVKLGLGKAKKLVDKRDTLKAKAIDREVERRFKIS